MKRTLLLNALSLSLLFFGSIALAGPKCRYPVHVDVVQAGSETSSAKALHTDGCVNEDAKWIILEQDAEHVLFAQIRTATGMPRLALAVADSTLAHLEFTCEQVIERDKEKLCDTGSANRTVKFNVHSK